MEFWLSKSMQWKIIVIKIKTFLDRLSGKLDMAEEKIMTPKIDQYKLPTLKNKKKND